MSKFVSARFDRWAAHRNCCSAARQEMISWWAAFAEAASSCFCKVIPPVGSALKFTVAAADEYWAVALYSASSSTYGGRMSIFKEIFIRQNITRSQRAQRSWHLFMADIVIMQSSCLSFIEAHSGLLSWRVWRRWWGAGVRHDILTRQASWACSLTMAISRHESSQLTPAALVAYGAASFHVMTRCSRSMRYRGLSSKLVAFRRQKLPNFDCFIGVKRFRNRRHYISSK